MTAVTPSSLTHPLLIATPVVLLAAAAAVVG